MRTSPGAVAATVVSLKGGAECLPRLRRIAACMAESIGLSAQEARAAADELACACVQVLSHSICPGEQGVTVTLSAAGSGLTAGIVGNERCVTVTVDGRAAARSS